MFLIAASVLLVYRVLNSLIANKEKEKNQMGLRPHRHMHYISLNFYEHSLNKENIHMRVGKPAVAVI